MLTAVNQSKTTFNPQMLVLARESRGLTQRELAAKIGISAANMCQIELNQRTMPEEALEKLSKLLKYPADFFMQEGDAYLPTCMNYRMREHVSSKLLMPLEAWINLYRLNIELLSWKMKFPAPDVPAIELKTVTKKGSPEDYETYEKVAKEVRKYWKVPKGPIENMTGLLEKHGIVVISFDFGTERVDSRTIFTKNREPIIFVNKLHLADRQRFSLAYELGHLVMHTGIPPSHRRDISHEANMFAAGFLIPANEIKKDFSQAKGITLPMLGELKRKWKVSMIALLYRAADLGFLTENQKRYVLSLFNNLKIRRREPPELDIAKEKPQLLRDLVTKYKNAHRYSVKEMAAVLHLEQDDFVSMYSD